MESCSYREVDVQSVELEHIPQFQKAKEATWNKKKTPMSFKNSGIFKTMTHKIKSKYLSVLNSLTFI